MSASYDQLTGLPTFYKGDKLNTQAGPTVKQYTGVDFGTRPKAERPLEKYFPSWDEAFRHAIQTRKMLIIKCATGKNYYVKYIQGERGNEAQGSQEHIIQNWDTYNKSSKQQNRFPKRLAYLITHN
tara:strand:+ start:1110 stop:1487 length:378 start_codon:yes stop_codon:yes gene_type:complete